jgi:hypothetical protein
MTDTHLGCFFLLLVTRRCAITVLAYVDELSYKGGLMGEEHLVVWYPEMGEKAPIYYCALGQFSHFYNKKKGGSPVSPLRWKLDFAFALDAILF